MNSLELINKINQFQEITNDFFIEYKDKINGLHLHKNEQIYSGEINNPDIVFIGINPGYRELSDAKNNGVQTFVYDRRCHYDSSYNKQYNVIDFLLQDKVLEILLNNKSEKFEKCASTNFKSFFATQGESKLNNLGILKIQKHKVLMSNYIKFILNDIKPKSIVCIGVGVFDKLIKECSSITIEKPLKDSNKRYFCRAKYNDINIYGVRHLTSGRTRPNKFMIEELKSVFGKLI